MSMGRPTNTDIMREIKEIHIGIKAIRGTLDAHGKDIDDIKLWKHDQELIKKIVAEQKPKEEAKAENTGLNEKLIRAVLIALGIIAALLGVKMAA